MKSTSALRFEVGRPPAALVHDPHGPERVDPGHDVRDTFVSGAPGHHPGDRPGAAERRTALRTRRAPVTPATVAVRARRAGEETTVLVRGSLRPRR
jgi:hypothetical protein